MKSASENITFSIYDSNYKIVSSGLTKTMVMYAFIEKKAPRDKFIIRDSQGLDMIFNEFYNFYY